jgi:hypothetical protein
MMGTTNENGLVIRCDHDLSHGNYQAKAFWPDDSTQFGFNTPFHVDENGDGSATIEKDSDYSGEPCGNSGCNGMTYCLSGVIKCGASCVENVSACLNLGACQCRVSGTPCTYPDCCTSSNPKCCLLGSAKTNECNYDTDCYSGWCCIQGWQSKCCMPPGYCGCGVTTTTTTTSTIITTTTSTTTTIPETTPPVVTIIYPWNRTFYKSSLDLNFTVNKPTSWIGYSLDNKPNVTITGNTILTGLSNSSHNVIVYATDLDGDTGSNATYFTVTIIGDVNGDYKVDIKDLTLVIKYFGSYPGHPTKPWNPNADLNFDNKVDIKDQVLVIKYYGTFCSGTVIGKLGLSYENLPLLFTGIFLSIIFMVAIFAVFKVAIRSENA